MRKVISSNDYVVNIDKHRSEMSTKGLYEERVACLGLDKADIY